MLLSQLGLQCTVYCIVAQDEEFCEMVTFLVAGRGKGGWIEGVMAEPSLHSMLSTNAKSSPSTGVRSQGIPRSNK